MIDEKQNIIDTMKQTLDAQKAELDDLRAEKEGAGDPSDPREDANTPTVEQRKFFWKLVDTATAATLVHISDSFDVNAKNGMSDAIDFMRNVEPPQYDIKARLASIIATKKAQSNGS